MKIIDDCIHFESTEVNYNKEKQVDVKQNTVRKISKEDVDKYSIVLLDHSGKSIMAANSEFIFYICIHCGSYSFRRELTDVTYWDERYIFSWKCSY